MPFELDPEVLASGAIAMRCAATTSDPEELSILKEMCCLLNATHDDSTDRKDMCSEVGWKSGKVSKSANALATWTVSPEDNSTTDSPQDSSSEYCTSQRS